MADKERDTKRMTEDEAKAAGVACVRHARDLLNSALAVQTAGHPNIAYHLGTLALEEIGKRALIGVGQVSSDKPVPPAWPLKHTRDHVQKIFWCLFDGNFFSELPTGKGLDEIMQNARLIHQRRVAALYVDVDQDSLSVPSEAISADECRLFLDFVSARVAMTNAEEKEAVIDQEGLELRNWFLEATENLDKRRQIFSRESYDKYKELQNTRAWAQWLRAEIARREEQSHKLIAEELANNRANLGDGTKDKWKVRVRYLTTSHSVRPKALKIWNDACNWIKLNPVTGKKSLHAKDELIVDFILNDNVPLDGLWWFGWGLANHFVVALNIATMGFWWWRLPEHVDKYYESLENLEKHEAISLQRNPTLMIDWGKNRVLGDEDMWRLNQVFISLPGQRESQTRPAYNFYLGGLLFMSLNDIHWQCEVQSFGNFWKCLREMMKEVAIWDEKASIAGLFDQHLNGFPLPDDERQKYAEICEKFEREAAAGVTITLTEVAIIKTLCDFFFMQKIVPLKLGQLQKRDEERQQIAGDDGAEK